MDWHIGRHCPKYNAIFQFQISSMTTYRTANHYTVAVLGQIATGGGADHLKEQMVCVHVPSLSGPYFM